MLSHKRIEIGGLTKPADLVSHYTTVGVKRRSGQDEDY